MKENGTHVLRLRPYNEYSITSSGVKKYAGFIPANRFQT
ncbi:hypothetical protein T08_11469 [Trichinella sp. T8]|nr:hypothetical protein T08_11469 [Trichinella sp. T8]